MFLIDQQKLDHSAQNLKVFSRLDIEFHSAIHTIAGNSMCRTIIRDVRMFVDRLRNLSLHRPTDLPEIIADHLAIATALWKSRATSCGAWASEEITKGTPAEQASSRNPAAG